MRYKKPRTASLDEAIISREGEYAVIEFREPGISSMNLKLGPKVKTMTDRQILNAFNKAVHSMEEMRINYIHAPVEIPAGKPQIKYFAAGDQWVPRGDVLRRIIDDGGPGVKPRSGLTIVSFRLKNSENFSKPMPDGVCG